MKTEDGCLNFCSCEAGDGQVKLIGSLQELKKGFVRCGVRTRGVRLNNYNWETTNREFERLNQRRKSMVVAAMSKV
jgi:hypothetical protein